MTSKQLIGRNRRLLGSEQNLYSMASELLEQPHGIRARARGATFKGKPNAEKLESLCNDLESNMYRDELADLAKQLGFNVYNNATKKELCALIASATYSPEIPENRGEPKNIFPENLIRFIKKYLATGLSNGEYLIIANQIILQINELIKLDAYYRRKDPEEYNVDQKEYVYNNLKLIFKLILEERFPRAMRNLNWEGIYRQLANQGVFQEMMQAYLADGGEPLQISNQ